MLIFAFSEQCYYVTCFFVCAADIPEEEARYWAKKLEQLNAMRDQDVRTLFATFPPLSLHHHLYFLFYLFLPLYIIFFHNLFPSLLFSFSTLSIITFNGCRYQQNCRSQYFLITDLTSGEEHFLRFCCVCVCVFLPQYAYQEEQERPLHAPSTQCCECLLCPPPPVLSPCCVLFMAPVFPLPTLSAPSS